MSHQIRVEVSADHVATVTLRCRADLSTATRERLDHGALDARRRGLMIAARSHVRAHYQIDDEDLRIASIAIARFRGRGEDCQAREFTKRALDRALISNYELRRNTRSALNTRRQSSASNIDSSAQQAPPLAA